jgi:hypothetical protein
MSEEAGLTSTPGIQEVSLLAALMFMLRLYFSRMGSLEKSQGNTQQLVETVQKTVSAQEKTLDVVLAGVAQLQERREDDTRALVSTLHEITLALQKISSQTEAHTKLIERLIDRIDRRD